MLIGKCVQPQIFLKLSKTVKQLTGAYGMVVLDREHPEHLVAARSGSPLVIGLGIGENFLASDQLALLSVTRRFIYLEEGDIAEITTSYRGYLRCQWSKSRT